MLEQLKYRQTQGHSNDLHGIQRWICLSVFDATQVGLVKAAFLAELYLCEALGLSKRAHT